MKKGSVRKKKTKAPAKISKQSSTLPFVIAGVLIIALVALGLWFTMHHKSTGAAATINGVPITQEQLDFQYALLPASYRGAFTKEQVLDQLIDEELVVQAAKKEGVQASPAEINMRVQEIMGSNDLSVNDLEQNLKDLNITPDQFENLVSRQIVIDKYLNKTLEVNEPNNVTLMALYNASLSQFAVGEEVTVRHVLIALQRPNAAIIAKQVYDQARSGTDFCGLVHNYTDDSGSKDTCGEYTFPRNYMVPEFENASFDMKPGEIRLVQTQFGYHVIQKINATPARTKTFDEVYELLKEQYQSADKSQQYRTLVSALRDQATIVYANGTVLRPQEPSAIEPNPTQQTTEPTQPTEQPPEQNSSSNEQTAPPATTNTTFFSCIASKAVLYGTSWNTDTADAISMFKKQGVNLQYVFCDKDAGKCTNIKAYPTWRISGTDYLGRMTVEQLKDASDC